MMNDFINNWKIVLLLCLTLGLAPFFPEPHIWGKLKWIAGGAVGMGAQDWFDFILVIRLLLFKLLKKTKQ